ncbi:MAG: UvrD-helicase domain-containing protein [Alphaproteobacteria bacterium]|nr:UvrD-helicase domain-containing protein [Alphaproteobacteria bacterium]
MTSVQERRQAITAEATAAQRKAYDPTRSVWLSASAGTGKTYVLIRRLLRLFLHDLTLKPSDILALTFTKAAAREMEERFVSALVDWSSLSEEALKKELFILLERAPSPEEYVRAKTLLTAVLDSEPSMTITTLHAFAGQVISRFPLESGIFPGSQILDDEEQRSLLEQALQSTFELLGTRTETEEPHWAFVCLAERMAESTLRDVFTDFIHNARRYKTMFAREGGLGGVLASLKDSLDPALENAEEWRTQRAQAQGEAPVNKTVLMHMYEMFAKSTSSSDQKQALKLRGFLEASTPESRSALFEIYSRAFLTAAKEPVKRFVTKKVKEGFSTEMLEVIEAEAKRVRQVYEFCAAGDTFAETQAYLMMASMVLNSYESLKKAQSQIDHDDLIDALVTLLSDEKNRDWVLYRLDQRYKHIMVDEAQDTDSRQWHIVKALLSEFFTGDGQHETEEAPRTFFTVGDMKQSIYRFRGAEPEVFLAMRNYLKQTQPDRDPTVTMKTSFRSGAAILGSVDMLLENTRHAAYAASGGETHGVQRIGAPGLVEIHPLLEEEKVSAPEIKGWIMPEARPKPSNKYTPLGRYVARWIEDLLKRAPVLPSTGAPAAAKDILILLKNRTMMPELIAALDAAGIAHGGADVMTLKDIQFVQDMLAVLRVTLNPLDQLSHLHVLKSPLWSMTDETVESLRGALKDKKFWFALSDDPRFMDYVEWVNALKQKVPYGCEAMLQEVVRSRGAIGVYAARQNVTPDVIDAYWGELLKLARAADKKSLGLASFVHEAMNRATNVKRAESGVEGVRFMTVHGSKGLESPIVILPDTTSAITVSKAKVFWENESKFVLLRQPTESKSELQKTLESEELERKYADDMKLLYVAMTRAEDQLMICGVPAKEKSAESWYGWIENTLEEQDALWTKNADGIKTYYVSAEEQPEAQKQNQEEICCEVRPVPTPRHERMQPRLKPSSGKGFDVDTLLSETPNPADFARGAFIHKCLEHMPGISEAEGVFLDRLKAQYAHLLSDSVMNKSVDMVKSVLGEYPEFFGEDSRAEVPFRVSLKEGLVSGIMDRMVISKTTIQIIDYKTASHLPEKGELLERYQGQVSLYERAMKAMYPEREVTAHLLWITPQGIRLDNVDNLSK